LNHGEKETKTKTETQSPHENPADANTAAEGSRGFRH
jgi:hypothetical protein